MQADILQQTFCISIPAILSFGLIFIRITAVFSFIPIPMMKQAPEIPKILFALFLTIALFPLWTGTIQESPSAGTLLVWMVREAVIGLTIGLIIACIAESLSVAAQVISMQAGYSYATSIDPNSQADSGVLAILAQLMATLLFFAFGFDRQIILALVRSLHTSPPGSSDLQMFLQNPDLILQLSSTIFSTALRIALPVAALLLIVDLTLALLSWINQQLQLLTVAFPAKMLLTVTLLSMMIPVIARIYRTQGETALSLLPQVFR